MKCVKPNIYNEIIDQLLQTIGRPKTKGVEDVVAMLKEIRAMENKDKQGIAFHAYILTIPALYQWFQNYKARQRVKNEREMWKQNSHRFRLRLRKQRKIL